jgi:hypothetical protein
MRGERKPRGQHDASKLRGVTQLCGKLRKRRVVQCEREETWCIGVYCYAGTPGAGERLQVAGRQTAWDWQ